MDAYLELQSRAIQDTIDRVIILRGWYRESKNTDPKDWAKIKRHAIELQKDLADLIDLIN